MRLSNLWQKIADALTGDDIMVELKRMLHDMFDAEYVIVFVAPEAPLKKVSTSEYMRIDFLSYNENVPEPEPIVDSIEYQGHRYVSADVITRELFDEIRKIGEKTGEMDIKGYDEILLSFTSGTRYIGFISLHRKKPFTRSEKKRLRRIMPFLKMAMRLSACLGMFEELHVYAFEYLINELIERFKLTPSEAYVIRRLLSGMEIEEIAEDRGTSVHAIKKIISSIYHKTGVNKRFELLRLVFKPD